MNGESDRGLLRCISSNLPMYLTHCSIGSSTESLKLLRLNHGKSRQEKLPNQNLQVKTLYSHRASKKACAFKFRPIGYDFYDVKHPIFFASGVSFFTVSISVRNRQIWGLPTSINGRICHVTWWALLKAPQEFALTPRDFNTRWNTLRF